MRYLISIDVGIKNLGLCVFDFVTASVVFWDNVTIVPNGRYMPAQNVQYVRDFVTRYDAFFHHAAVIVVERQMRCNMRIIESVLQAMFFNVCTVINARSVKLHYGISTRNYRNNKQKAVQWAEMFVTNNRNVAFAPGALDVWDNAKKRDDLADSLLMTTYYLDTYNHANQPQVPVSVAID